MMDGSTIPDVFAPVVSQLADRSQEYFGTPHVTLRPVSHVERQFSNILRIQVESDARSFYGIVKVVKTSDASPEHQQKVRQRITIDFAVTLRAYESLQSHPGLGVVRPIACFPEEMAIVTEEAQGSTFASVLDRRAVWHRDRRSTEELVGVAEQIGAWLRAFQTTGGDHKPVGLGEMREYLDVRLCRTVRRERPEFDERTRQAVLRFFDRRSREVSAQDLLGVSIHADFSPENVLVDGGSITVLDFTMASTGAIYHDLSHMFLHLEKLKAKWWGGERGVDQIQRAMLRGFDPNLSSEHPLFELLLLQHMFCRLPALAVPSANPLTRLYQRRLWKRYLAWVRTRIGQNG